MDKYYDMSNARSRPHAIKTAEKLEPNLAMFTIYDENNKHF